jgi:hypothetical protein
MLDKITGNKKGSVFSESDIKDELVYFSKRINIEREKFEYEIHDLINDIEDNEIPDNTNKIFSSG